MHDNIAPIREVENISKDQFHNEIVPLDQPVVIRSHADNWPAVAAGREDAQIFSKYLKQFNANQGVYTIAGEPSIAGRFFYNPDLRGVNFQRANVNFTSVLDQLLALANSPNPHAIAVQSASVRDTLPKFDIENPMSLLDATVEPTFWLGNRAVVAPHYDVSDNLAIVVHGRRKFTLFPPDQVANLYVGPALDSPGGVPISLVEMGAPDFDRFPNYRLALEAATSATLQPGDAIFIPSPWWHAVESLDPLNMLVNYWWGDATEHNVSANNSMMLAMLTISNMSAKKRASWKHYFDYYVFRHSGDPAEHLPEDLHDILTNLTPEQTEGLLKFLKNKLS